VGSASSFRAVAVAGLFAALILTGCERGPEVQSVSFIGVAGSGQPRLVQAIDGTPILSWLEPDAREYVLKYARYESGELGAAREIVRSDRMFVNWADLPSIVPVDDSLWFAHWLRRRPNGGAYDIATLVSHDAGSSWVAAEQMNEDDAEAEHGFVEAFPWQGGLAAFWLDGRELANWSFDNPDALLGTSLRLAHYDASGAVRSREIVDEMVCDCCQPAIAMTSSGPVVAYRDRTDAEIRDVVVRRQDAGRWAEPVNVGNESWFIEGCPVNGPAIAATGDDVVIAWFTAAEGKGRVRFARSGDGGASFAMPVDVDADRAYGQPGIALDSDGRAVVSWWGRSDAGGIELRVRSIAADGELGPEVFVAHESIGQPVSVPQLIRAGRSYLLAWATFDAGGTVRLARLDI